jgi:hypothetical protein
VISRVVFTGKSEDPELRRIFANAIAMGHLASMGALFGTQGPTGPLAPHLGSGSIPAAALPQGSVGLDDGDEADPAETRAAAAAASGAPVVPPLPPQAPKPAPAPGDPARVYLPGKGKEAPTVAKAAAKDLTYWEARLRREFDEGMDERYAHKNTVLLLTIRAFWRATGTAVEPHEGLDAMDPKSRSAAPAPKPETRGPTTGNGDRPADPPLARRPSYGDQRSTVSRPPSDKGPPADNRSEDQRLADQAFGPDDDDRGDDDR